MAWFGKKEEVPEVAVSADVSGGDSLGSEISPTLPELPSFPGSPANDGLNQEIVKSAVGDGLPGSPSPSTGAESPSLPEVTSPSLPDLPKGDAPSVLNFPASSPESSNFSTEISDSIVPSVAVSSETPVESSSEVAEPSVEASSESVSNSSNSESSASSPNPEPIFVRLDKFQDSQKIFKEIRETVTEIESVLGKIRGVKSKEEIELNGWTKEVESLKRKLSEIDSEIFNQI